MSNYSKRSAVLAIALGAAFGAFALPQAALAWHADLASVGSAVRDTGDSLHRQVWVARPVLVSEKLFAIPR